MINAHEGIVDAKGRGFKTLPGALRDYASHYYGLHLRRLPIPANQEPFAKHGANEYEWDEMTEEELAAFDEIDFKLGRSQSESLSTS